MSSQDTKMRLGKYAEEYANDPEFIAEGLSIKVVEEMLDWLEKKNLSQSWLAQKMGVSRAHVSRILNAPPNMTLLTIAKIAVALGVRPDVSLNTESLRLPASISTAADAVVIGRTGETIYFEFKPTVGAVQHHWSSAAENQSAVHVPQTVTA